MSSILTALKKLEGESEYQVYQEDVQFRPGKSDAEKALYGRTKNFRRFSMLLFFFSIAVIFFAGVWVLPGWKSSLIPEPSPEIVSVNADKRIEGDVLTSKPDSKNKVPGSIAKKSAPPKIEKRVKSHITRERTFSAKSVSRPNQEFILPISPVEKEAADIESGALKRAAKRSGTKEPGYIETSQPILKEWIDDSRLKLQAIAWSNNPEKRIAVINDHIVREGSSIEGVQVTMIKEDEVVVREGTDSFKLVFKLK